MERHKVTFKHTATSGELAALRLYTGLFNRVAAHLGVTRSVVARVAKGTATSARITQALVEERSRIEEASSRRGRKKERAA